MVDRYEALRHRAFNERGISAGLALFLGRGMAAWMHAWKEYAPTLGEDIRQKRQPRAELPLGIQGDLVMTLVNMALNIRRGEA